MRKLVFIVMLAIVVAFLRPLSVHAGPGDLKCDRNPFCTCYARVGQCDCVGCVCGLLALADPVPVPTATPKWYVAVASQGTPYFDAAGRQIGWLEADTKLYYPLDRATDGFGKPCAPPATPRPAAAPVKGHWEMRCNGRTCSQVWVAD